MEIKRDRYLKKLISYMRDGQIKVITGIRRCGKSYLLQNIFKEYLFETGVPKENIISFKLDLTMDIKYRKLWQFKRGAGIQSTAKRADR